VPQPNRCSRGQPEQKPERPRRATDRPGAGPSRRGVTKSTTGWLTTLPRAASGILTSTIPRLAYTRSETTPAAARVSRASRNAARLRPDRIPRRDLPGDTVRESAGAVAWKIRGDDGFFRPTNARYLDSSSSEARRAESPGNSRSGTRSGATPRASGRWRSGSQRQMKRARTSYWPGCRRPTGCRRRSWRGLPAWCCSGRRQPS
jgi:hypothetical protein